MKRGKSWRDLLSKRERESGTSFEQAEAIVADAWSRLGGKGPPPFVGFNLNAPKGMAGVARPENNEVLATFKKHEGIDRPRAVEVLTHEATHAFLAQRFPSLFGTDRLPRSIDIFPYINELIAYSNGGLAQLRAAETLAGKLDGLSTMAMSPLYALANSSPALPTAIVFAILAALVVIVETYFLGKVSSRRPHDDD